MSTLSEQIAAATVKAMNELRTKSIYNIQCETAVTWCGRALASYSFYTSTGELQALLDAEEYAHEAIEHGALAGSPIYETIIHQLRSAKGLINPLFNPLT